VYLYELYEASVVLVYEQIVCLEYRFVLVCCAGGLWNTAPRMNDKVLDKAAAIPRGRYKVNNIVVEYLLERTA